MLNRDFFHPLAVKRAAIPLTNDQVFSYYIVFPHYYCYYYFFFLFCPAVLRLFIFCGGSGDDVDDDDGVYPVAFVRHDRPAISPLKLLFFVVFREESCASP